MVYDNTSTKNRALSEDTASIMNRLLRQVVVGESGTGRRANMGDMDVVGKTGTSQDYYDRAFVGMTPYYIGGFWTGYDTPAELPESRLYSPDTVWKTIMTEVHEGLEPKQFELSDDVVSMEFCVESGLAVTSRCTKTETGYYKKNALPGPCDMPHEATDEEGGDSPENAAAVQ